DAGPRGVPAGALGHVRAGDARMGSAGRGAPRARPEAGREPVDAPARRARRARARAQARAVVARSRLGRAAPATARGSRHDLAQGDAVAVRLVVRSDSLRRLARYPGALRAPGFEHWTHLQRALVGRPEDLDMELHEFLSEADRVFLRPASRMAKPPTISL